MANTQLFDRIINLEFHMSIPTEGYDEYSDLYDTKGDVQTKVLRLVCPDTGFKPKIRFRWHEVPSDFCYNCTIEVTNLWFQWNPIWVDTIKVEAGYSNKQVGKREATNFTCTVFSSYKAEPGPDGVTVFECLVATADVGLIYQPYSLAVYNKPKEPWTIREVLLEFQRKTGIKVYMHPCGYIDKSKLTSEANRKKYLDRPFTAEDIAAHDTSSLYELITELQTALNNIFKSESIEVATVLFNDTLHLICAKKGDVIVYVGDDRQGDTDESIYFLDRINSAEWNAGVLTVVAPWAPMLRPGTLIKIRPNNYAGSPALPNIVQRANEQFDRANIYSILTTEVIFSTLDENTMTLKCIPMKYSAVNNGASTSKAKIPANSKKDYVSIARTPIDIILGAPTASTNTDDLKNLSLNISSGNTQAYQVASGDTLSCICIGSFKNTAFRETLKLPAMNAKMPGSEALESIPASMSWYPVIMVLTYDAMKNNKDYWIDIANPDSLKPGKLLILPKNLSWKTMQMQHKSSLKNIYEKCAEFYKTIGKQDWAKNLELAANLIDKGIFE